MNQGPEIDSFVVTLSDISVSSLEGSELVLVLLRLNETTSDFRNRILEEKKKSDLILYFIYIYKKCFLP